MTLFQVFPYKIAGPDPVSFSIPYVKKYTKSDQNTPNLENISIVSKFSRHSVYAKNTKSLIVWWQLIESLSNYSTSGQIWNVNLYCILQ